MAESTLSGDMMLDGYISLYRHVEITTMKPEPVTYDCWIDFGSNKATLLKKVDGVTVGKPEVLIFRKE